MRTYSYPYGPGDMQTWGPCLGHPNDPRTPEVDYEEAFEEEKQKALAFINEHVCGEWGTAGTSHGVTAKVMPFFRLALAGLPAEKKLTVTRHSETLTGQDDFWTGRLMKAACWGMDSQEAWKFKPADVAKAEEILLDVLDEACERLAEDQAAGRC